MIELPEKKAKGKFTEILIISGLFMASFYFIFSKEVEDFLRRNNILPPEKKKVNNKLNYNPQEGVDKESYIGRSEFCSKIDSTKCVKGFVLPNNIDDLKFINNMISIITLPDSIVFDKEMDRNGLSLTREGNDLVYYGKIYGDKMYHREDYDVIKSKIILMNNKYYKQTSNN